LTPGTPYSIACPNHFPHHGSFATPGEAGLVLAKAIFHIPTVPKLLIMILWIEIGIKYLDLQQEQ
jgi:hypothetical protein